MTINLDELLDTKTPRKNGSEQQYPKTIRMARRKEKAFRSNKAVYLATQALKRAHPGDWTSLLEQAHAKVNTERGPLPGDPGFVDA